MSRADRNERVKSEQRSKIDNKVKLSVLKLASQIKSMRADGRGLMQIPEPLMQCENLKKLDLSNNNLHQLPKNINKLKSLEILLLNNNKFEDLPDEIGLLVTLIKLCVTYNQIADLSPKLGKLCSLRVIDLSHNSLSHFPIGLCYLQGLRELDVSYNKFSVIDTTPLWLTCIEVLRIDHNMLVDLPFWFTRARCMYELNISHNPLDIMRTLRAFDEFVEVGGVDFCTNMENLRRHLDKNPALRILDVRNCGLLANTIPLSFIDIKDLVVLRLGNDTAAPSNINYDEERNPLGKYWNMFGEFPEEMNTVLGPSLRMLDLRHLHMNGLPPNFSACINLEMLLLRGNPIMWLPTSFKCLTNLQVCDLSSCNLVGHYMDFSNMRALRWLSLSHNKLTAIDESLQDVSSLIYLDLYDNELEEFPDLFGMPSLNALDLGYNCFLPQDKLADQKFKIYETLKNNLRMEDKTMDRWDKLKPSNDDCAGESYHMHYNISDEEDCDPLPDPTVTVVPVDHFAPEEVWEVQEDLDHDYFDPTSIKAEFHKPRCVPKRIESKPIPGQFDDAEEE